MFIVLLELREALKGKWRVLLLFGVFSLIVWITWAIKAVMSRRYRPWTRPYETTSSVVVPVVDEPEDLFIDVLDRITAQNPHEVIVVINGPRNEVLERVCQKMNVAWLWTEVPGKRNAVRIGTEIATGDVVVLVDSDTLWTHDTLAELVKPFADPRIGGVSTKQRILEPRRCFYTRWADWMENTRALYSMPAQSTMGLVGCLPGRTIAFRRSILDSVMDDFMTEEFLGVFLEVSDDRTLTNLCLKAGYRTVYQSSSLVYTDSPVKIRKLYKQQLRWARGSQYNTMRMMPWMVPHAPVLAFFFAVDILLPFLLAGSLIGWGYHAATHTGVSYLKPMLDSFPGPQGWLFVAGFIIVGSTLSMWLRQHRHLVDEPRDWPWIPAYILFSSFFLMPIRLIGFFRMAHVAGWGTRKNAYVGQKHGRINPKALIPYVLGLSILGAEIALVTRVS